MPSFPDPDSENVLAPGCDRCDALVDSRNCIVWGNGPLDAAILVVGEAPGAGNPDADQWQGGNWTGLAYTSQHSGRRIRDLMASVGYIDESYFTNAVKCFPENGEGSNREPTATERANCRPHLQTEINQIEPAVVIPTGKHATQSVLSLADREFDSFLDTVLDPIECPELETTVLPLVHPSYQGVWISRLGYTEESYQDALETQLAEYC